MLTGDVALTDTTIVPVPRDAMNIVVPQDPRLARQTGEAIEVRRKAASEALAASRWRNLSTSIVAVPGLRNGRRVSVTSTGGRE